MRKLIDLFRNKWADYLLEITVIVVGILIAFSLNTWKENRELKKVEIDALKEIKAGLLRLEREVNYNIEDESLAMDACHYILDNFERNAGLTDSLGMSLTRAWVYSHIVPDMGPYRFVENNGTSVISNIALRNEISNFYGLDLLATVSESKIREAYIERVKLKFNRWYITSYSNWYDWQPSEPLDYNALSVDADFLHYLRSQLDYCKLYKTQLLGLNGEIKRLTDLVDLEMAASD